METIKASVKCEHEKGNVKCDRKPDLAVASGEILWRGTCECGKRVYEIYVQQEEIYEEK